MMLAGPLSHIVAGALAAWLGERLRRRFAARGLAARVGAVLAQLSALGFALRGAIPPDAADPAATATRLHALAWSLWWIAFVPGLLLLGLGALRDRGFAAVCLAGLLLVPWLALRGPAHLGPAPAAALADIAWAVWWLLAARRAMAGDGALR